MRDVSLVADRADPARLGLRVAEKPDSQDICFVPSGRYHEVVARFRPDAAEPGEIAHLDGRVLGRHAGVARFTVGQGRGLGAASLSVPDRILAAAVAYQSGCEPRPYRERLSADAAARRLADRVRAGELDAAAAEAVLQAAGHRDGRAGLRPGGLTPREIEVLGLLARGASNRQIASALTISEKTARNHVERIYAKIGVSNRIGAGLYAVEHGLAATT